MKKTTFTARRQYYRKPGQDYSKSGYYFITMNTQNWQRLFGHKLADKIILNDIGKMLESIWASIPNRFPNVNLDEYVIMPDHFHAIIQILPLNGVQNAPADIPLIISAFKSITTVKYIDGVKKSGWPRFNKRIWHFRFYDRIISNSRSLNIARKYIQENPAKWNP